ncbi:MAG: hypothetical protein AAF518_24655, partial [Spirochaetota bacterium]
MFLVLFINSLLASKKNVYQKKDITYQVQQEKIKARRFYYESGKLKAEVLFPLSNNQEKTKILHVHKKNQYLVVVKKGKQKNIYGAKYKKKKWQVVLQNAENPKKYSRLQYSSYGKLLVKYNLNSMGKLLADKDGIAKYVYRYNKRGHLLAEYLYSHTNSLTLGKKAYAIVKYTYHLKCLRYQPANECYRTVRYYGSDKKLTKNKDGVSQVVSFFNRRGKITKKKFLDEQGKLSQDKLGISFYRYFYNRTGNLLYEKSYGFDGKLKEDPDNIAILEYSYARKNREITVRFKGKDSSLREGFDGYSKYTYLYDKLGNRIAERYYNLEDKLLMSAFHQYTRGKQTFSVRYNSLGKATYRQGQARVVPVYQYNRRRKKTAALFYTAEGRLLEKVLFDSFARYKQRFFYQPISKKLRISIKYSYDIRGRIRMAKEYDAQGILKNYHIFDYDSNGNLHINKRYGETKKLSLAWDGIAIKRYTYDINGKRRGEEYFGKEGEVKEDIFGVHKVLYEYDDTCLKYFRKKEHCLAKIEFYNAKKKRTAIQPISLAIPRHYNMTLWENFKKNAVSISAYRFVYNQKGRMISRETLDEKDKLLARRNTRGIAKTVFGYDTFGNPRLYETYDANYKLRNNIRGVARYHFLYIKGKKAYEENYNQNTKRFILTLRYRSVRGSRSLKKLLRVCCLVVITSIWW